jgi:hypothetical protein
MSEFHTKGAVPIDSPAYVERTFENELFKEITRRHWVLLLGPRQHGKSSSLVRLKRRVRDEGMACARVDLQSIADQPEYAVFLKAFATQAAREYGHQITDQPTDPNDLEAWLTLCAPKDGRIVLFIDEAAAIRPEFRNTFYSQLRSIANGGSEGRTVTDRLVCVFSGSFVPQLLVQDSNNSPFNVCTFVYTNDLTLEQAESLFATVITEPAPDLVKIIFELVGGQPYLLQTIFDDLSQVPEDQRATEFLSLAMALKQGNDDGHTSNLFRSVLNTPTLSTVVTNILVNGFIPDSPADLDIQLLVTMGLVKRLEGRIVFRNNLYQEIARLAPQFSQGAVLANAAGEQARMFPREIAAFSFITDPNLREVVFNAYNAGVNSYIHGFYRLSLISFGSALEGILITWLTSRSAPDLSAAVTSAKAAAPPAQFRKVADETDPINWTLANMIRVTRQSVASKQISEPNEALREWRNLIHPAVVIKNYHANSQLDPEARQANAMLDVVLRDIAANMP